MKSVKNYVYTERAHFMCPNMHFGIMAKIESNYDEGRLKQSVDTLQKVHPFLQSLIAEETDHWQILLSNTRLFEYSCNGKRRSCFVARGL